MSWIVKPYELESYADQLRDVLQDSPRFAYDWETEISEDRFERSGVLLSIYHPELGSASFPVGFAHEDIEQHGIAGLWDHLEEFFTNTSYGRVTQNGSFDVQVWRLHGCNVAYGPLDFDTLIASWCVDPKPPHNLHSLGEKYQVPVTKKYRKFNDLLRECKVKRTSQVPVEKLAEYCEQDCVATYHLMTPLNVELDKYNLREVFRWEMDKIRPLIDLEMEWIGVPIDREFLEGLDRRIASRLEEVEAGIYRIAGVTFNIRSPIQLRQLLYDKLKLEPLGRDGQPKYSPKTAAASTNEEVLSVMAEGGVEIASKLLEYRALHKLRSTYTKAILEKSKRDGRLHANFNQTGTMTTRWSSSKPNLQNIPVPKDESKQKEFIEIRRAFVPPPGYTMVGGDYSQIELRILAHFSQDENLLKTFRSEDGDIHTATAERCGIPRRAAKVINFGVIYGMQAGSLAKTLKIRYEEAVEYLNIFFDTYPGINYFKRQTIKFAKRFGYLRTISGHLRRIEGLVSSIPRERIFAENICLNTPIQGSASDIMKHAMVAIREILPKYGANMVLQVHDEVVGWVPNERAEEFGNRVSTTMKATAESLIDVPVKVDVKLGKNWLECK
jgi:DNA polymerase-1